MTTQLHRKGGIWMENDPEANSESSNGANSTPGCKAVTKQDKRKQSHQMLKTNYSTRATRGQRNQERIYVICKYIISLLLVAAVMLPATSVVQAGVYITLTHLDMQRFYIDIPANTPVSINVYMDNDVGENVTGLTNGIRIYSLNGAVWQTPTTTIGDSMATYFDLVAVVNEFSVDGTSDDTIGVGALVSVQPGVPDGYTGLELFRVNTQVSDSEIGDTICIDSSFFPPGGTWLWSTPSGSVIPDWGGPYCYAIIPQLATIEGTVFDDVNGDGVWDQPAETGMPGVTVNLTGTVTQSTTTGSNGGYSFIDLAVGTYRVYEDVPSGYLQTFPTSVSYKFTITGYAQYTDIDFGNTDSTCETEITTDTCFAGTDDDFVGAEPSSPDAELLALMGNATNGANPYFDSACVNQSFGHTFSGCWPESCKVVGASLCMRLKATGSNPATDKLYLGEWGDIGAFWAITMNDLEAFAGGNGSWILGDVMTVCLDLADLPAAGVGGPQNLLGGLQDGRLDVLISDDTEVDYLELIVETCCEATASVCGVYITLDGLDEIEWPDRRTFDVNLNNCSGEDLRGISHGFRLYSPDGAEWETPVYYSTGALEPYLDGGVFVNGLGVDGISEDTITLGGYAMYEPGIPIGFDEVVVNIETQFDAAQVGKTFCIDSTWFPPSNTWKWTYSGGSLIPDWGGPYCWNIIEPDTCYADGDANGNGTPFEAADAVELANVLVNCASLTAPLYRVDLNGDCLVDSLDLILMVEFITTQDTSIFDPYGGYPVPTCCDPDLNRNPQTLEIFGFEHTSIGSGCIDTSGGVLEVTSDQPDGVSGVAIGLQGPYIAFGVSIDVSDSVPPVGAEMTTIVEATVGGSPGVAIASTHREKRSDHVDFYFDFDPSVMGSANLVYRVYDGCEEVISVTIPPCTVEVYSTSRSFGDPLDGIDVVLLKKPENSVARGVQYDEDFDFVLPGPVLATGTRIEVFPAEPGTPVDSLTAIDIQTRNISFFEVIDEQATINDTTYRFGLPHNNIGFCVIDTTEDGDTLVISDPGIGCENAVSVDISGRTAWQGEFHTPDTDALLYGASRTITVTGMVDDTPLRDLLSYCKRKCNDTIYITADFDPAILASGDLRYEVLLDGRLVSAITVPPGQVIVTDPSAGRSFGDPLDGIDVVLLKKPENIVAGSDWDDTDSLEIALPDQAAVYGNQLRIILENPAQPVDSLDEIKIQTDGIATYSICYEQAATTESVEFFDVMLWSLGFATLDTSGGELIIGNIGSGGDDGVEMDLGEVASWSGMWLDLDSTGALPNGAFVSFEATGVVGAAQGVSLGIGRAEKTGAGWEISADYSGGGGSTQTIEVYSGGTVVASASGHTGPAVMATGPPEDWHWSVPPSGARIRHGCTGTWDPPEAIEIIGLKNDAVLADSVKMIPEGDTLGHDYMTGVTILAADIPEITFTQISVNVSCCIDDRGNVNNDPGDNVDISDLVYLVDYMFTGGPAPVCEEEADMNGDGGIDISDLVYLVDYMFTGGPAPVSCGTTVKTGKAITQSSDISFDIEYANETSTVVMNSPIDLRGIQLELKGTGPAPENLVGEHVDMVHGRDGSTLKIGLLDLDGGEFVSSDVTRIIRLKGEYTLESVTVADLNARSITPTIGTVQKPSELPADYALSQNYPNPFNPSTSIAYALPEAAEVQLTVYNLLGRRVSTVVNQPMEAGHHIVEWSGHDEQGRAVSSGVYFYRLETPRFTQSKKMVLLK